jgi:hypothetical protein
VRDDRERRGRPLFHLPKVEYVRDRVYCTGPCTRVAAPRWEPDQDAIRRAKLPNDMVVDG